MQIDGLLRLMVEQGASDLHFKAGRPPLLRVNDRLVPVSAESLSSEAVQALLFPILDERQKGLLANNLFVDLAHSLPGVSRFRVTVYRQRGTLSAAFRRVPFEFPGLDDWNLPEVLKEFARLPQGLVLVTGPAGSGKSSTLAALIREIVSTRPVHVVCIEDPIEFLISDALGSVSQREVGTDTHSFADALRNTVRQDPDVIMVGEMRDTETIGTVLTAAETGHLVFSTLHTNSAAQTVDRVVTAFPEPQHRQVRQQLSQVLEAVVSLKLVDRTDEQGMVAAVEIMRANPRVRKLVHDGSIQELYDEMERSAGYERMQSLNQSLTALVFNGVITRATAMAASPQPADLDLLLRKTFGVHDAESSAPEGDMGVSKADFSHIMRLHEVEKAYEELQERYAHEIAERDATIRRLEAELQGQEQPTSSSEGTIQALTEEKAKLMRQVAFQKQEYDTKIEKLQMRIKELSLSAEPARAGLFRR